MMEWGNSFGINCNLLYGNGKMHMWLTYYIKHWGLSGYSTVLPRIKVRCRGIRSQLRNPQRFIPPTLSAILNRHTHRQSMASYIDKINNYIKCLDNETLNALQSISSDKKFKKGDLLLQQNEICGKSYLIISGIARKYYLNDGKEITTELYFDNDLGTVNK